VAQVVDHLLCKCKTLSSNPRPLSAIKKKKKALVPQKKIHMSLSVFLLNEQRVRLDVLWFGSEMSPKDSYVTDLVPSYSSVQR
jgi:hypothetical protein